MPVEEAVDFSQIERLFGTEGDSLCNGWCILPDGTGFSHVRIEMPKVTPEVEEWWHKWSMDPDYDYLNYRIWMPSLHLSHAMPIVENLGWGMSRIQMFQPIFPQMMNLSALPSELDSRFFGVIGSSGYSTLLKGSSEVEYTALISCLKRLGEGLQVQAVGYMGMKWEGNGLVKAHDADPERTCLFVTHNAYEFTRKADLAPRLYEFANPLPNQGLHPNVRPPVMTMGEIPKTA
ncbi:MAG: hypothetical protein LUD71_02445 [Clostridiales bacterium]|nr:hypothetical protein [Clostridiales bacterium]